MAARKSIIMIGAPDSGKTNYLGRLWGAFVGGDAGLRARQLPDDVRYVDDAFSCLLRGEFAPRTDTNVDVEGADCSIDVEWERAGEIARASLLVPDVSGELWRNAVHTNELLETWFKDLRESIGALIFLRVGSGAQIPSLDWVAARERLQIAGAEHEPEIPTDVQLCEFLRLLEVSLAKDVSCHTARVAVLVAAWDILDEDRSQDGPGAFVRHEFPLFAGRLADVSMFEVETFGVSVVGGDFRDEEFRGRFLAGDVGEFGYVVTDSGDKRSDVTLPLQWILDSIPMA